MASATKVVTLPNAANIDVGGASYSFNLFSLSSAVRKVVYNVHIPRDRRGALCIAPHQLLLGVHSEHAERSKNNFNVVIIFADSRSETWNPTWACDGFQDALYAHVHRILSCSLPDFPTTLTLVNYEAFSVPIMKDPSTHRLCTFDRHKEIVREMIRGSKAIGSDTDDSEPGYRRITVAEAEARLRFATIDEYRATLQPGEWELETEE